MNEQDLDKILSSQPEEPLNIELQKQFQRKVKRAMNRSLYGRTVVAVLLIGVLMTGLFFGTSKVVDLLCYRPEQEPAFLENDAWENEEFTVLFEDTISTYFSGRFCFMAEPLQSHGFGRYSAPLFITDAYGRLVIGPENGRLHIDRSKLDVEYPPLTILAMEFYDPEYPYSAAPEEMGMPHPEDIRQELHDLPKSAYLDVSLSFPKAISAQQTAEIINHYSKLSVRWLALEGQNTTAHEQSAGGMFMTNVRGLELSEEEGRNYPGYALPDIVTGEDLEQCLKSRLQLLIDHPKFVSLMESRFPDLISMSRLEERLANANDRWACYGMRLVGSPEEIERLMDDLSVTYARINNVKISRYQK